MLSRVVIAIRIRTQNPLAPRSGKESSALLGSVGLHVPAKLVAKISKNGLSSLSDGRQFH